MTASISHRYLWITIFPALASLFAGAAAIIESNAGLIDLRAEWLRNHDSQVGWADPSPSSPDLAVVDTDGDGLVDDVEAQHHCDPLQADTDHDGLTDGHEILQFGTDPRSSAPDQDGDGITDYAEAIFSPVFMPGRFTA